MNSGANSRGGSKKMDGANDGQIGIEKAELMV